MTVERPRDKHRDKLKILFLPADKFPPFRVDVAVLFGKKIVERGHTVDWVLQSEQDAERSYQTQWSGCSTWVGATDNGTSRSRRLKKHLYSLTHDFRIFSLVRKYCYDYIIVRDKFPSAILAIAAAKLCHARFVYWLSFPFPEWYLSEAREGTARYPWYYRLRGYATKLLLYKALLPWAHHVFVQSEQMRKDIACHGIPWSQMTPVPMGVSTEDIPFFGYPDRAIETAKEKIVLYLGTLSKFRKIDFLVRAFEKVLKREKNAKLYLVGSGDDPSDEQQLRAEVQRLGIEDAVVFTGFLPQKKAWEYVKDALVCVSPFRPTPILNSTSPTKLIEYMAMGKAAVANDHPEQSLVISQSQAGLCVPYEEEAFAEAILYLLSHLEEVEAMGRRGRAYVERERDYEHLADIVESKLLSLRGFSSIKKG